ncbi:Uncharacterised protein [Collinsella intestinalis]|uniref:Uncharacterized protein n=1 Tax=Collinsella intestinalis TaxID=147207 RepID=A0A5K1IRC3_9ACTN|nr:hypothetical protein [Collinsella intestinalis]VWL90927.1 Uncharacterised protein [Collinsella intestinalis]
MADQTAMPLTDEEREELEALRAEKARRAEEERARVEREELEALRAEQERVDAEILAERAAEERAARKAPAAKDTSSRPAPQPAPTSSPKEKTFGERMVTSNTVDDDGIPTMPVAQKIIIAVALVAVVAFIIYTATR